MNITRDQFYLQIERLSDTFGEKYFPEQRTLMIWETVSDLEYNTVIAVVDAFIRNSKHAPLPSDFIEAVRDATKNTKRKYSLGEIQPREIAQCFDCGDSGFIRLKRNETFETWAVWETGSAPCHCYRGKMLIDAGQRKPKNPIDLGPQFGEHWKNSYTVLAEYENSTSNSDTVKNKGKQE
jgi:hypothetical protein